MVKKTEFIINNLFKENFINKIDNEVLLEEPEESGATELTVQLNSSDNYCIKNPDNNGMSNIGFFRTEKRYSMQKRVDHIIFENIKNNNWIVHLIEMKTTVSINKWRDVKGKFRASLLFSMAIAAMLDINVKCTKMYTTYEKVNFEPDVYSPTSHRGMVGTKIVRPEDEWNGKNFMLDFGEKVNFEHIPIKMKREENILRGFYSTKIKKQNTTDTL